MEPATSRKELNFLHTVNTAIRHFNGVSYWSTDAYEFKVCWQNSKKRSIEEQDPLTIIETYKSKRTVIIYEKDGK